MRRKRNMKRVLSKNWSRDLTLKEIGVAISKGMPTLKGMEVQEELATITTSTEMEVMENYSTTEIQSLMGNSRKAKTHN